MYVGCHFDYAAVALIAAGKERVIQMKYRKFFRIFMGLGRNVGNRWTEFFMGQVIFKRWTNTYNRTAEKVSAYCFDELENVQIEETGMTSSESLDEEDLQMEKEMERHGKKVIKLMNLVKRAKDRDGERLSERVLRSKYGIEGIILESVVEKDYERIEELNRIIEGIINE